MALLHEANRASGHPQDGGCVIALTIAQKQGE